MSKSLKEKAISGMIWNGVERFGSSFFLFLSNLVLARLLSPEDFGCIGMLMVFISLSQAIIDGGFGSALIQKKEPTQTDYSTIFFWNIALSILLYIALFFLAPVIAEFYKIPTLVDMLRVLGTILIFNALFLVQDNRLKKSINFKKIANINLAAIVVGTVVGIVAAYYGYGAWSLVIKTIITSIIQCGVFWVYGKWKPTFIFCWSSFKNLFRFGGFMFLNIIINTLYFNSLALLIGKWFSPAILGYFTQARKLEDIPRSTIASVINNVFLPVFSELQNDKVKLKVAAKKIVKAVAFINFPIMTLMCVIAKPMFMLLFSEKWMESVPLFQILCGHGAIFFMYEINSNITNSVGKSKVLFKIRLIQVIIGILLITIGSFFHINYAVIGYSLSAYISYVVIASVVGKIINYGIIEQGRDLLPIVLISLISAIVPCILVYLNFINSDLLMVITATIAYSIVYLILSVMYKTIEFHQLSILVRK